MLQLGVSAEMERERIPQFRGSNSEISVSYGTEVRGRGIKQVSVRESKRVCGCVCGKEDR